MRVEITSQGALRIEAETPTERYALRKWCEENIDEDETIKRGHWCIYYGEK